MPELAPLYDEDIIIFKKIIRRWLYIVLAAVLLFVISMFLTFSEPGNMIIVDILLMLQFVLFIVAAGYFLKNQKVIKELRHRAMELRRHV